MMQIEAGNLKCVLIGMSKGWTSQYWSDQDMERGDLPPKLRGLRVGAQFPTHQSGVS